MTETTKENMKSVEMTKNDRLNIRVCKLFQITIFKPLLSTKLALFLWFSASSAIQAFLTLLLKQEGLKLEEISLLYGLCSFFQVFSSVTIGILVDKLRNFKYLLVFKLILTAVIALCLISLSLINASSQKFKLYCEPTNDDSLKMKSVCGIAENSKYNNSCKTVCPDIYNDEINTECRTLGNLTSKRYLATHRTFSMTINDSQQETDQCLYKVYFLHNDDESYNFTNKSDWRPFCEIICYTRELEVASSTNRIWIVLLYFVVLLLLLFSLDQVYRLFDITSMHMIKEHNSDYGKLRIFGLLGPVIAPYLTGLLIEASSVNENKINYALVLYVYSLLCVLCAVTVLRIRLSHKEPAKKMWKATTVLVKNPDVLFFALVVFILGSTWGFFLDFKYLYLKELGAQPNAIGLLSTANNVCSLAFLLKSKWILDNLGCSKVFILAHLGYAISCLGLSFLQDAWPAVLLEMTSSLSYHLLWVAVLEFCFSTAPQELTATMCACTGSLHFNIGRGCGSLFGGLMMKHFGGRVVFRAFGALNTVLALLYGFYLFYKSTRNKQKC